MAEIMNTEGIKYGQKKSKPVKTIDTSRLVLTEPFRDQLELNLSLITAVVS